MTTLDAWGGEQKPPKKPRPYLDEFRTAILSMKEAA